MRSHEQKGERIGTSTNHVRYRQGRWADARRHDSENFAGLN